MSPSIALLAALSAPPSTEWSAPPGCPDVEVVLAEARSQGAEPFSTELPGKGSDVTVGHGSIYVSGDAEIGDPVGYG